MFDVSMSFECQIDFEHGSGTGEVSENWFQLTWSVALAQRREKKEMKKSTSNERGEEKKNIYTVHTEEVLVLWIDNIWILNAIKLKLS